MALRRSMNPTAPMVNRMADNTMYASGFMIF
jgi:hypothetical protein